MTERPENIGGPQHTPQPDRTAGGEEGCGGAKGIRTPDLLRAKQMLYQLSYRPKTRENRE